MASRNFPHVPGRLASPSAISRIACRIIASLAFAIGLDLAHLHAAELTAGPTVEVGTAGEVTVRWSTDVATRGRVQLGRQRSQMDQRFEGGVTNRHAIQLKGLVRGQDYFYSVGTARTLLATNSFFLPDPIAGLTQENRSTKAAPPSYLNNRRTAPARVPPTRKTWGTLASLPDHFDRHGRDFRAKDSDEYARLAWEFLQRARTEGLPAKLDDDGVLRVFEPNTRSFAAYNRDGTTKTFFKPESRDYFDRQPGRPIDVRTWREK